VLIDLIFTWSGANAIAHEAVRGGQPVQNVDADVAVAKQCLGGVDAGRSRPDDGYPQHRVIGRRLASAVSIAVTTAESSGSTSGRNRARTAPSRPDEELLEVPLDVSGKLRRFVGSLDKLGVDGVPLVAVDVGLLILRETSRRTSRSRTPAISCAVPGSWPSNWLEGTEHREALVGVLLVQPLEAGLLGVLRAARGR
jgi:hypothetical protein